MLFRSPIRPDTDSPATRSARIPIRPRPDSPGYRFARPHFARLDSPGYTFRPTRFARDPLRPDTDSPANDSFFLCYSPSGRSPGLSFPYGSPAFGFARRRFRLPSDSPSAGFAREDSPAAGFARRRIRPAASSRLLKARPTTARTHFSCLTSTAFRQRSLRHCGRVVAVSASAPRQHTDSPGSPIARPDAPQRPHPHFASLFTSRARELVISRAREAFSSRARQLFSSRAIQLREQNSTASNFERMKV